MAANDGDASDELAGGRGGSAVDGYCLAQNSNGRLGKRAGPRAQHATVKLYKEQATPLLADPGRLSWPPPSAP